MKISKAEANRLYSERNNQGLGYAPYTDVAGDDTIDNAVEAAIADEWELVHARTTSDEIAVLRNGDDEWLGIGGDTLGRGAWAVVLSDVKIAR